jgi:phosphoribosylamine--glycine ligase
MKVLIVGSGGREHALAWKFAQSSKIAEVYVAPGNAGMKLVATCIDIAVTDIIQLKEFAIQNKIDLTVIGPEIALEKGIVDEFIKAGLNVFGPTKKAAEIETSKIYAKELMNKYQIPTANYQKFSDCDKALAYIKEQSYPLVIKVDNLANGKGVIIARSEKEAQNAIRDFLINKRYNCQKIIIETFLEGEEFSLMAFVHGNKVYPLVTARDYKKAYDLDLGPNTGGMGCYSEANISELTLKKAIETIMIPCAKALVNEGRSFTGILYGGLIATNEGPKVIEFNARFGDPETEVVLPRLKNDLFVLIADLLQGKEIKLEWESYETLGVVLAAKGYPNNYQKNFELLGVNKINGVIPFYMGVNEKNGKVYASGGRVLILVGKGKTKDKARQNVYKELRKINCEKLFYRADIGI